MVCRGAQQHGVQVQNEGGNQLGAMAAHLRVDSAAQRSVSTASPCITLLPHRDNRGVICREAHAAQAWSAVPASGASGLSQRVFDQLWHKASTCVLCITLYSCIEWLAAQAEYT